MRRLALALLVVLGSTIGAPVARADDPETRVTAPTSRNNSPSVAVDPENTNHVAIATQDIDRGFVRVFISHDGGRTFAARAVVARFQYAAEPSITFGRAGQLFLAYHV